MNFQHILNTPGLDVQIFQGTGQSGLATATEWQTWQKPNSSKVIFMLACGGGGAGGSPLATGSPNTSCYGGGGGGSGLQAQILVPTVFLPDFLYLEAGGGGQPNFNAISGNGMNTVISFEPVSQWAPQSTLMVCSYGEGGWANGGASVGLNGPPITMVMAKGLIYSPGLWDGAGGYIGSGQANGGFCGAANNLAGLNITTSQWGIMVNGGAAGGGQGGGGGSNTGAGGSVVPLVATDYFNSSVQGGSAGNTIFNAGNGQGGIISDFFMLNFGGGGGGATGGNTYGNAGTGGQGAPGCGGGGAGGATSAATRALGGAGGDGFIIMISY